jgi:hypothetical protein
MLTHADVGRASDKAGLQRQAADALTYADVCCRLRSVC